ncbi:hypothetical protein ACFV3E_23245 [Streptomyces sp. NPDC059718]
MRRNPGPPPREAVPAGPLAARADPAASIQARRDHFGAHTYRRTDRPGSFHTRRDTDRTKEPMRRGRFAGSTSCRKRRGGQP